LGKTWNRPFGVDVMKETAVVAMTFLMATAPIQARQAAQHGTRSCLIEVLHSEELPIGPMFFHTIKATLLVTAPGAQPFESTVREVIPWQMPPPRAGKRVRVRCDPAAFDSSFRLFD
jgi:hypothetical protein